MKIDWTNNLVNLFQKDLDKISSYDKEINQLSIEALESNPIEALQAVQKISYYLIASRSFISMTISNLKRMDTDLNDKSQALIKRHEHVLIAKLSRLTEIREDIHALQKLSYTLRQNQSSF